jgi:hypothetical protein
MRRGSSTVAAAVAAAAAVVLVAGCGGGSSSRAGAASTTDHAKPGSGGVVHTPGRAGSQTCNAVPAALEHRILAHMILKGAGFTKVAAVEAAATPGYYYITTQVTGGGAPPDSLATWATKDLAGGNTIYAVDSFAALISTFGASVLKSPYLVITAPGAYRSRVCVLGHNASHGAPAPAGGGSHSLSG